MKKRLIILTLASSINFISANKKAYKQSLPLEIRNQEKEFKREKSIKVELDRDYYNALITEIRRALIEKDFNIVKHIIEINKISPNHPIEMTNQRYLGTLLDLAVESNYIPSVKFLISKGANVNRVLLKNPKYTFYHKDKLGFSPLHIAALNGNLEMIKLLLNNNADVNARAILNSAIKYKGNLTPLHIACINYRHPQSFEIVKYLIEHGANPNIETGDKKKAIDIIKPGIILGGSKKIYEYLKNLPLQEVE